MNCSDVFEDYNRVLLVNSSLINNEATEIGAAVMVTHFNVILVSCKMIATILWPNIMSSQAVRYLLREHHLNTIWFKNNCSAWHGNRLDKHTTENIVGTFGQKLSIKIDSKDGAYGKSNDQSGLVLYNVTSGKPLPKIEVSVLDIDGKVSAPLYEEGAIVWSSPDEFLARPIAFSFENGTCVIEGIVSFVHPRKYTIMFNPKSDDVLEVVEMTIIVRECVNNEEPALDGKVCQPCSYGHYNFDPSKANGCAPCPKGANCAGRYIVPLQGYWHKSPCQVKVKRCIVEEACKVLDRIAKLDNFTRDLVSCNMTYAMLSNYNKAQCHKVNVASFVKD